MQHRPEQPVIELIKNDPMYYPKMIDIFEAVSTQKKIPKEIIIPVFDCLYKQNVKEIDTDLVFQICFDLSQKLGVKSLDDLRNWFDRGHYFEVDKWEIKFY